MTATNRPAPKSQGRGKGVACDCSKGILYGRRANGDRIVSMFVCAIKVACQAICLTQNSML
jgi:hypothetical protein